MKNSFETALRNATEMAADTKHIFEFLQRKWDSQEAMQYLYLNKTESKIVGRMVPGGGSEYANEHSFTIHGFVNSKGTGVVEIGPSHIDTKQCTDPRTVMMRLGMELFKEEILNSLQVAITRQQNGKIDIWIDSMPCVCLKSNETALKGHFGDGKFIVNRVDLAQ